MLAAAFPAAWDASGDSAATVIGAWARSDRVHDELADQRRVHPWHLLLVGGFPHIGAHAVQDRVDRDPGGFDMLQQGVGERAVAALGPIGCRALGIGGEGDQRALGRDVDARQSAIADSRAVLGGSGKFARKRVVAAGVEDDDVDPLLTLHLAQDEVDIDRVDVEVGDGFELDVDREKVVVLLHRDAVSRIVDERRLGIRQRRRELRKLGPHFGEAEIVAVDDFEADPAQRCGHALCVDRRIFQGRSPLVGAVADDERNTPLGRRDGRVRHTHNHHRTKGDCPQDGTKPVEHGEDSSSSRIEDVAADGASRRFLG